MVRRESSAFDSCSTCLQATADKFAKENLNVAAQFADYLKTPEVDSVEELKPGCGAVLARNGLRVAAYRDDAGVVYERSAVCRHLGCVVHWNSLEKSWDCPCHGSRYDTHGRVFQGPANSGLPEAGAGTEEPARVIRRRRGAGSR